LDLTDLHLFRVADESGITEDYVSKDLACGLSFEKKILYKF